MIFGSQESIFIWRIKNGDFPEWLADRSESIFFQQFIQSFLITFHSS